MADFGDDMGESMKRISNAFWRELFHQWLRDAQSNDYQHEHSGGEDYDVKLFDNDAQRKVFEEKLKEAGIEYTEKSVPAVRFNHKDAKKVEEIYKQIINDIDTGIYTPSEVEKDCFDNTPASTQVKYDLEHAVEEGKLPQEDFAALGKDFTMGDVEKMLEKHQDLHNELSEMWLRREQAKNPAEQEQPAQTTGKTADAETQSMQHTFNDPKKAASSKQAAEPVAMQDPKAQRQERNLEDSALEKGNEQSEEQPLGAEHSVDEPAEKDIDEFTRVSEHDALPELEHAELNGVITKEELGSIEHESRRDARVLEERHPDIAQKLRDAGYDMNDLTKNDSRMRPSHDGGDPDSHTQVVEGSWKEEINQAIEASYAEGMNVTDFATELRTKHGINIATSADGGIKYSFNGNEHHSINSENTRTKLAWKDFNEKGATTLSKAVRDKAIEAKLEGELSRDTARALGRGLGLPDAPTDPIRA